MVDAIRTTLQEPFLEIYYSSSCCGFWLWSCMYVWSSHIARVWINWVRLPILLVVSWTRKMNISLSAFAPENLVSRDRSAVPSRVSLLISILRLSWLQFVVNVFELICFESGVLRWSCRSYISLPPKKLVGLVYWPHADEGKPILYISVGCC